VAGATIDHALWVRNLGLSLARGGDLASARTHLHQALDLFRAQEGADPMPHAICLIDLSELYLALGDRRQAKIYCQQALAGLKENGDPDNPFASRARDRALHAVLVAAIRHLTPGMLDKPDQLPADRRPIEELIEKISERASRIDKLEIDVKSELIARLDSWIRRSPQHYWWNANVSLMQGAEEASAKRASGRIVVAGAAAACGGSGCHAS